MGGGPRRQTAPRSTAKFLTFERSVCVGLNITSKKKVNILGGGEKCTTSEKSARPPEKILPTRMTKVPHLMLGWGPRMVNPALRLSVIIMLLIFTSHQGGYVLPSIRPSVRLLSTSH